MTPIQSLIILLLAKALNSVPEEIPNIIMPALEENPDIHRLPNLYNPHSYRIELTLPSHAFTENSSEFSGKVSIYLAFLNVTNYISLNANHKVIDIKLVMVNNIEVTDANYHIDSVTDILTIKMDYHLGPGKIYVLYIEYIGYVATDLNGLHRVAYKTRDDVTKYLVSTLHARRVFPCFDKPALKATFNVTVTFPTGLNILFNTRELTRILNDTSGLTTVTFKRTPKMSTNSFGLIVSELTCTSTTSATEVPIQICSRDDLADERTFAIEYAPKILDKLIDFTNSSYNRNIEKLDLVAMPEAVHAVWGTWGLITFWKSILLWDKNNTDERAKQYLITLTSHAMSNLWFKDLVTFKRYSEVFLQEGLATHLGYYAAQEVLPAWEFEKQFFIEEFHEALIRDVKNSRSLYSPTTLPEQWSRFDDICYKKGGSIMRMVHHIMQFEHFREGIRNYLNLYQYSNTDPENLWFALSQKVDNSTSKLPANLSTVMAGWIIQSGFPLLSVTLTGNDVTISQTKFSLTGRDDTAKWYVPVSYSSSFGFNKFYNTFPSHWLTPYEDLHFTVSENYKWIILNNQVTGFYRVNYDLSLWQNIKTALLRGNYDGIPEINRAQLVDDLFFLGKARLMNYTIILDFMRFLRYDESYYTWRAALGESGGFPYLVRRLGESSKLGKVIMKDMMFLLTGVYLTVPLTMIKDDDHMYTLKQMFIVDWACKLGEMNCVNAALQGFENYRFANEKPHKNIRSIIYCNGLRYSKDHEDWNFLWNAFLDSVDMPSEHDNIRIALGCTRNKTLLKEYLTKTTKNESGLMDQFETLAVLYAVGAGSVEGLDVAFDFLIENHKIIEEKYTENDLLELVIKRLAERISSRSEIDKLKKFVQSRDLTTSLYKNIVRAIETAESLAKWLGEIQNDIKRYYFITPPPQEEKSYTLIIVFSCLGVVFFICIIYLTIRFKHIIRDIASAFFAMIMITTSF